MDQNKLPKLCDYSDDSDDSASTIELSSGTDDSDSDSSEESDDKALQTDEHETITEPQNTCVGVTGENIASLNGEITRPLDFKDIITHQQVPAAAVEIEDGTNFRERKVSTSSETSDDSSDSSTDSDDDIQLSPNSSDSEDDGNAETANKDSETAVTKKPKKPKDSPRVKGELTLADLEPIIDLHISVPENKTDVIGRVFGIVDVLVTVESYNGKPALDLGTVLFLDNGKRALGHVFDVFGPTKQPYYCVRFNSAEHIAERGIKIGALVYAAPGTEHTRYVFLSQLEKLRGTDASWKDDHETPQECIEFSDDEEERTAKNKHRRYRPKQNNVDRSLPPQEAVPEVKDRTQRKRNYNQHANQSAPQQNWFATQAYRPVCPPFGVPQMPVFNSAASGSQLPNFGSGPNVLQNPYSAFFSDPSRFGYPSQVPSPALQTYNWYNYDSATHPGNWYANNPALLSQAMNWQAYAAANMAMATPPPPPPEPSPSNSVKKS